MGTHPIFESDFDCLTDMRISSLISLVSAGFAPASQTGTSKQPQLEQQQPQLTVEDFAVSEKVARAEYEKFLLKFPGSNFNTNHEAAVQKFKNFHQNLARIGFYNFMEKGTATYGVTEFTDLSLEEFKKHKLGLKIPKNFSKISKKKSRERKLLFKKSKSDLPDNFDWTEQGVVTPVKNQGMCGSCWAFSTTGNVEGVWAKQTGQLIELSEQELVDCDQIDQGCNGGLMDNAFAEIQRLGGLETEDDYKYDAHVEQCQYEPSKARVFINGSKDISDDEDEIAEALMEHGPLSIALNAAWMQFYHGGVSHPLSYLCNPEGLDHGVLLVGFGIETKTSWRHWHPRPFWKIKNSWGPHWGENGYYRIYRGEGVCGVNKYVTTSIIEPVATTTTTTETTTTTTGTTTTTATSTSPTTTTQPTTTVTEPHTTEPATTTRKVENEKIENLTDFELEKLIEKLYDLDDHENNDTF